MKSIEQVIDQLVETTDEEEDPVTWEVDSLANVKGTFKVGELLATYPELTSKFGDANMLTSSDEASRGYWRIVWSDGLVAEIYDWKQFDKDFEEVAVWNVASKNVDALFRLQDILKEKKESLGVNRDYKTRDRRASQNLAKHFARMKELMAQGLTREEASKQAFEELFVKKG